MKFQTRWQNSGLAKVWMISIIIILLIVIGGGIYWWNKTSTSIKESETSEEESFVEEKTEQTEEPKEFIVDCGDAGPEVSEEEYETMINCMEEKFKECNPAKFSINMDLGPLGGETAYYYEIIGSIGNLCEVKSKYLKNINPDWVGKEMFCQYDNSKDFETAIQDMSKCKGSLYDLMMTTSAEAKKGEKFTPLTLGKPEEGSGYEWKMNYDSSYVQFIGESGDIESGSHVFYEFLALKSGKTKIEFSLQSGNGEEIEKQIVEVTIE